MVYKLFLFFPLALFAIPGYFEPWDKDVSYPTPFETPKRPSAMAYFAQNMISFHQNVLSAIDGPRSHFRPTSSKYMSQAIHKYGFLKGWAMGCDRLLRENPDPWIYRTAFLDGYIRKLDPVD